jgi:hypothetical protein
MAGLNLDNLTSDDLNGDSDNDSSSAPLTSFKLPTSMPPRSQSKSVGALSPSMALPPANNLPSPAAKPLDRVETLEEKIARVMAGINLPKNLPAKSPTALPTSSPFERFSLATKSNSNSSLPVSGVQGQTSPLISPNTTAVTEAVPAAVAEKKKTGGARIVRPGSNNSLVSLAGEEKSETPNPMSKLSPDVVSTRSQPSTPLIPSSSLVKNSSYEISPRDESTMSRGSLVSPSTGGEIIQTLPSTKGIAIDALEPTVIVPPPDLQPEPVNKSEPINLPENSNPTRAIRGGRIVRGDSPSPALASAPSPSLLKSPEVSPRDLPPSLNQPTESTQKLSLLVNEVPLVNNRAALMSPAELSVQKGAALEEDQTKQVEEDIQEEQEEEEPVVEEPPSPTAIVEEVMEDLSSPSVAQPLAPVETTPMSSEVATKPAAPLQSRFSSQPFDTPAPPQKSSRVVRPTSTNAAPSSTTPTPTFTRSKSQERSRTPSSGSSVGSSRQTKPTPSTPSFTPQQRRIPELPSALSTVGYTRTPESSSVGGSAHLNKHNHSHNEWSITKRSLSDNTPTHTHTNTSSQLVTVPRYNTQLSNMFPDSSQQLLHDVKVVVRIRPFTVGEIQSGPRRVVSVNGDKLILVNPNAFDANPDAIAAAAAAVSLENMRCNDWAKVFCFDNCFWSYDPTDEGDTYVDQQGIFDELGASTSQDILHGISTCCFAYGHTSTGKTYSMFGGDDLGAPSRGGGKDSFIESEDDEGNLHLHPSAGLIPRVFMDVLTNVFADPEVLHDTKITLSFLEIYQEKIRDCLSPINNSAELRVREHPALGPYVENLTRVEVESVRDVLELLYRGYEERSTASTLRNRHSSRSHAIATLELSPADAQDPFATLATGRKASGGGPASSIPQPLHIQKHTHIRCQMVDLAGSEKDFENEGGGGGGGGSGGTPTRRGRSTHSSGDSALELKMIRRSLSTLGYIIKALGQGHSPKGLPFRDSVLTWLLKDALSGHSRTTMLATISPSHTSYDETLQTLKYAERLCQIIPSAKPGMESTARVSINDTIDPELSYALAGEFTKLKHELGGQAPGSMAAKHLHQHTLSDPQQRLAKLDPYRPNYIEDDARYQSTRGGGGGDDRSTYSMVPMSASKRSNHRAGGGGGGMTHSYNSSLVGSGHDLLIEQDLKEAYRQLHGKYVELQIELENTRTDRDSLHLDVKKLQESLERAESEKYLGSRSALSDMTLALRSAESEVNELRGVILRKEETSDRLLGELADERQARETVERTARAQVTELINRLEALHR